MKILVVILTCGKQMLHFVLLKKRIGMTLVKNYRMMY
jgi:hypothetical protein